MPAGKVTLAFDYDAAFGDSPSGLYRVKVGDDFYSYRAVMSAIYAPRLAAIGFDPAVGAHKADDLDRQKLRQDLVRPVALQARDEAVRAKLLSAGQAYLAGDMQAVDDAFLAPALLLTVQSGGLALAKSILDKALNSQNSVFCARPSELGC